MSPEEPGVVYFVGAGPGDPDLITVQGARLLSMADVVVADELVSPVLLDLVSPTAELLVSTELSDSRHVTADEIAGVLVSKVQDGKVVVRLLTGDPFVCSDGAEEAAACRARGVEFQVVPGVSAALAAPAFAGIPLSGRDGASFFIVTAATDKGAAEARCDLRRIAHAADSLILQIEPEQTSEIASMLMSNGRDGSTPMALIQWASLGRQRVAIGTLAAAPALQREIDSSAPVVCVIGNAVNRRESLRWFRGEDGGGLRGKRIVVTRAQERAGDLSARLLSAGAQVVPFAAIRIEPLDDYSILDRELLNAAAYRWVIFTSGNAVKAVAARLEALGRDARLFASSHIAAIGPATGAALRRVLGLQPDYMPSAAVAEGLINDWPDSNFKGMQVLLPRAVEARPVLPKWLEEQGASVTVAPCYRTVPAHNSAENLCREIAAGRIDAITFASAATAQSFAAAIDASSGGSAAARLQSVVLAAIGPVTADALLNLGIGPTVVAKEHTVAGLVAGLEEYFGTADHHSHAPSADLRGNAQPGP